MPNIAFIAEFNPPHNGHAYFVEQLRHRFGRDARIIAIMSGNYVQRGTAAIIPCYKRAEMALNIDVDLVLELPYPYSASTAEKYALSGVAIANELNNIDYLAFGSECGDIEALQIVADFLSGDLFQQKIVQKRKEARSGGYAQLRQEIIEEHLSAKYAEILNTPNNILAIEYLRALKRLDSSIKPYTIRRIGSYHSTELNENPLPSASSIRKLIFEQNIFLNDLMTKENISILQNCIDTGEYVHEEKFSSEILKQLFLISRLSPPLPPDCSEDLYERIMRNIGEVTSMDALVQLVRAKHETETHIRRVLLHFLFGTTVTAFDSLPRYTRVLAANYNGRQFLREVQKITSLHILTKTADHMNFSTNEAKFQSELAIFADKVYNLCMMAPRKASDALRTAPIIKK